MNLPAVLAACERIQNLSAEFDRVAGELIAQLQRPDTEEIPGRDDQGALNFDRTPVCAGPNPISQVGGD